MKLQTIDEIQADNESLKVKKVTGISGATYVEVSWNDVVVEAYAYRCRQNEGELFEKLGLGRDDEGDGE